MFKTFRENNCWMLRYSGWRLAIPAIISSFICWIMAEIIFFKDNRKEKRLAKNV